jgi:hypothetical protein
MAAELLRVGDSFIWIASGLAAIPLAVTDLVNAAGGRYDPLLSSPP